MTATPGARILDGVGAAPDSAAEQERQDRLAERRRTLPDEPGVYLFIGADGEVLYVGKARSVRKRVASHFSSPITRGDVEMVSLAHTIDVLALGSETEALIAENQLIKRHLPPFNVQMRDDKSYPYIAISTDEEFPRVYVTRERHRRSRLYFGPYSSARRTRETLEVLNRIFLLRSCTGTEPGRRSGSPCLDFHINRCGAPCVGKVTAAEYQRSIDGVVSFLSGRYREIERDLEGRMQAAAEAQEYESAARERNRLTAMRTLLERQRVANDGVGSLDVIAVAVEGADANAQVFQVRDDILADRQSFYLDNPGELAAGEVIREFLVQYYADRPAIPPQLIVQGELPQDERAALAEALSERRGSSVEVRAAERGDKRKLLELAERNARLALEADRLQAERRRQRRVEALDELQQALGLDMLPLRIECFDISNLMGTHTVASMVVFEGGAAKKSDYRKFNIRTLEDGVPDDFAAMREVLTRRIRNWESQTELSPHDPAYDESFATLPSLIVIDGGRGQLAAGLEVLQDFRERGVAVASLAKRIEEVFLPGRRAPVLLAHETAGLQLLQQVRDEAHRFAIGHHRTRRDKAMTTSILDDFPG
ncbi:MAG: excinuclease ABC subunit UvrC, partial [Actinobacteria bacterium]|nr:excinuclease ABC subunit UvrC [Actinomycetota bacterium]